MGGGEHNNAGIAQLARAQAFQAWGRGFESRFPLSTLLIVFSLICCLREMIMMRGGIVIAQVAQSVEHVLGKDEVGGSIPLLGLNIQTDYWSLGKNTL